jgi:predicted O-methyltransferase YrrM
VGDNTLLFGALSGENPEGARAEAKAAMLQFNEALADAGRFQAIMLPTPEGLSVARLKA